MPLQQVDAARRAAVAAVRDAITMPAAEVLAMATTSMWLDLDLIRTSAVQCASTAALTGEYLQLWAS